MIVCFCCGTANTQSLEKNSEPVITSILENANSFLRRFHMQSYDKFINICFRY